MKILALSVLFLPLLILADFYAFEDGILFSQDVSDGWIIPNGVKVISVDANWWRTESFGKSWWDVIENAKLEYVGKDLRSGKYTLLSKSPVVFKSALINECFTQIDGLWFSFQCKAPGKRILKIPEETTATLFSDGGWNAVYKFDDGILTFYALIKTSISMNGNLHLVSGKYFEAERSERSPFKALTSTENVKPTQKTLERSVYDIGDVQLLEGENSIKVFEGRAIDQRRVYFASFSVGSSSDWIYPRFTVEIENTRDNGLGYPMPNGMVHVFKDGIPVGSFELEGSPAGGTIRILENEVFDLRVKQTVLSSKKEENGYLKKLKIDYENRGSERTVVIKIYGRNLKFMEGNLTPLEEADDFLTFKFDAQSGKSSFTLIVESSW